MRECETVREKAIGCAAIARLLGLDAPKAVEVSGKDGGPVAIHMTWGDIDNGNRDGGDTD